jgi:hypothetical protein
VGPAGTAAGVGALVGQNQDVGAEMDRFGLVVRLAPADGRPACVMFTWAGQLGYHGINSPAGR